MDAYTPFKTDISKLELSDLEKLISERVPEGWFIEFKSAKPSNLQIARSIAAFANSDGGWLILGISTDQDNIADQITGIDKHEFPNSGDWIRDIVRNSISPVPQFTQNIIHTPSERLVFVIYVNRGVEPPYVTRDGRIYRRVGAGSDPIPETDRFALDKLHDRAKSLADRIDKFSDGVIGPFSSNEIGNRPVLELYVILEPFGAYSVPDFHSNEGIESVRRAFYGQVPLLSGIASLRIPIHSVSSGHNSYILRHTGNARSAFTIGPTVEIFETGNLKIYLPIPQVTRSELGELDPAHLNDSDVWRDFSRICSDWSADDAVILDMYGLFSSVLILLSQYFQFIRHCGFSQRIGVRARVTDSQNCVPFLDSTRYLTHISDFGLPFCLKREIEIPEFRDSHRYRIEQTESGVIQFLCLILEALGVPASAVPDSMSGIRQYLARKARAGS